MSKNKGPDRDYVETFRCDWWWYPSGIHTVSSEQIQKSAKLPRNIKKTESSIVPPKISSS